MNKEEFECHKLINMTIDSTRLTMIPPIKMRPDFKRDKDMGYLKTFERVVLEKEEGTGGELIQLVDPKSKKKVGKPFWVRPMNTKKDEEWKTYTWPLTDMKDYPEWKHSWVSGDNAKFTPAFMFPILFVITMILILVILFSKQI